ncbi:MAG: threonine synthase [Candidatus Fimenecus sp.]
MLYTGTRDNSIKVNASEAIAKGICDDGGLFVPMEIPKLSLSDIKKIGNLPYKKRAEKVLKLWLTDFSKEELEMCIESAYESSKFSSEKIAPLKKLNGRESVLELWRGPTCAFKDMALQLLPHLLSVSAKKNLSGKKLVILTATSGDTGKAALEGFKDAENIDIIVFYPTDGVSAMQKMQMITQEGSNVSVCAINGNFDDCQNGVKKIFTNSETKNKLLENGYLFSSANSINWGRLAPQIVYYVSAYCDLVNNQSIELGEKVNFCVPTGNFGDILAGYYAREMGVPIKTLICASNINNVLTEFFATGIYNKNRSFYQTASPSMDILISSNLERLLWHLSDKNSELVKDYMEKLKTGEYTVSNEILEKINKIFAAGFADDVDTQKQIKETFEEYDYLLDTHTAVAQRVYEEYVNDTNDLTNTVVVSTANPYKFSRTVLSSFTENALPDDDFECVEKLSAITGIEAPKNLTELKNKRVRFKSTYDISEMHSAVFDFLGIK